MLVALLYNAILEGKLWNLEKKDINMKLKLPNR
ncbi:Uncharacterized protein LEKG_1649 [Leuconostoc gasicomitatum KG16-1]|nr:Uncharacterized protein LEKG_1649 [Leuconostoc gasicomitatum KG16-1]